MRIARILPLLLLLVTAGCAATKVGDAPPGSSARVYFYSSKGVSLSDMAVNGHEQGLFDMGLEVPAGQITATASFEIEDEACFVEELICLPATLNGECRSEFTAKAGGEYAVRYQQVKDYVSVLVFEEPETTPIGAGRCEVTEKDPKWPQ